MEWGQLFYVIGAFLVGIMLYKRIKGSPELFSGANMSRSLQTLGLLALLLIGFVAMCVFLLKHSGGNG